MLILAGAGDTNMRYYGSIKKGIKIGLIIDNTPL